MFLSVAPSRERLKIKSIGPLPNSFKSFIEKPSLNLRNKLFVNSIGRLTTILRVRNEIW